MSRAKPRIADIYPLSPLQQGLLFHSLYAPASGVYCGQTSCVLEGELDAAALRRAWQLLVDRHGALRTAFVWEKRDEPFQVVYAGAALPWEELDWREVPPARLAADLESYLAADRERGFDLGKPPLLRCALIRTGPARWFFLWSSHHLLLDGWCLSLLFREVFLFYEALRAGGPAPSLPPPPPYRDYIAWLQRQDRQAAAEHWRGELGGVTAPTPLGIDRPPAAGGGASAGSAGDGAGGYAERELQLAAAASAALRALAQRHDLTLSTFIQGFWGLLLSRYSGEPEVVFGATVAGRPAELPGAESMVGLFINTLPVRMPVPPDAPLLDWLQRSQERQVRARVHEHSPLVEVQGWSGVARGRPLFESLVVFESYPVERALGDDNRLSLRISGLRSFDRISYPLSLLVLPGPPLVLRCKYDRDRLDDAAIDQVLAQLAGLCAQAVADPARPLAAFSLVTPGAPVPDPALTLAAPSFAPVPDLLAEVAAARPDLAAVTQGDEVLTYGELMRRADALARRLIESGLGPGGVVAVAGARSFGLVAALVAVLRAGGVLLAVDPALPAARRRRMIEQSGAGFLLAVGDGDLPAATSPLAAEAAATAAAVCRRIPVHAATGLAAAPNLTAGAASGGAVELPRIDAAAPAYLFFTSGTTAVPKAVLGRHAGLGHFLAWQRETFAVGAGDRSAQLTGLSFDVVLRDLFLPLTSGATLCLPDAAGDLGGDTVLPWLARQGITRLHAVPSLAASWLEVAPAGLRLPALRTVFFAGEPLTGTLACRWRDALTPAGDLINLYGPTETTLAKCWWRVPAAPPPGVQPVGFPLPHAQALVLAPGNRRCGIGEAGEIVIRTPFRSAGYVAPRPEDAARFLANPFRDDAGDLLYRTGDRGRLRPDGALEILGRLDHQIKVRGVRVEPDEVAAVLAQHPGVLAAAVVGGAGPDGLPGLAAYWVAAGEAAAPAAAEGALREHLGRLLPAAMVPWSFSRLAHLPLGANGKLDRAALPAPAAPAPASPATTALGAPRTPLEEVVAGIWCEVLRREQVGVAESFFELGGHSLTATRVVARLRRAVGVEVTLRELFEGPTVAALARRIEERLAGGAPNLAPPLAPAPRGAGDLPLSFAQERLWFLDQLEPGSPMYNVHVGVRLRGVLDTAALAAALGEVVRRHDVLRTAFTATADGRARQAVQPPAPLRLPRLDLAELAPRRREGELRRLTREATATPFDLARPPLLAVRLVRLALGEHALLLTLHHIVCDGWSIGLFIREVTALYRAFAAGAPSPLAPLALQYADFAAWQRAWLQGDVLEREVAHWRERLAGAPPRLDLPADRPRPAVQSLRGARASALLPASLWRGVGALARRAGATPFIVLLAAFQDLLRRYARRDDVVVGTPIAGRGRLAEEELIGLFVNSLVLRTDLAGDPTYAELLGRVREGVLQAHLHQDLPFEKLVEALQPERDLAYNPLFQVMLVLQDAAPAEAPPAADGLAFGRLADEVSTVRFDLTVSATAAGEGLFVLADYATDLFDAATVNRLLAHLRTLLEAAAADAGRHLSAVAALAAAERHQLLAEWNDTAEPLAADLCLHQGFERQAALTPAAPAVEWDGGVWTYGELEAHANRLARHLRALGVGPEARVGLCAGRSPETIAALLGILKAGGAYVPLDPELPEERLAVILDHAALAAVVTRAPLAARFAGRAAAVVRLDADAVEIAARDSRPAPAGVTPANLAYILHTSGSTGQPLGVMVAHAAVAATLAWRQLAYRLGPADAMLQSIPSSFDPSLWQIFGALGSGARLVLPAPDLTRDAARLVDFMAARGITVTDFPPSLLRVLLEQPDAARLERVRHLFAGGEALPRGVRDRFAALLPGTLYNIYGPTEAAIDATVWACRRGDADDPVPIGRPIAGKQVLLLGPDLAPVPAGVPGELCIAGDGLARGYVAQGDRTAARFVPHPFAARPGERLYRTGDLARARRDGALVFLGRTDHQVKVRGVRIELEEVEAALRDCPGVVEAAAAVRHHGGGEHQLVAFLVAAPAAALAVGDLTRELQRRLPQAMVPAAFELLPALPRTPTGKLDRARLAAARGAGLGAGRDGRGVAAPRTPREALLAEVWAEVLRVPRVGVDDNFFELGGDSILSIQIAARARLRGLRLTPKQLFQNQTVARLAAVAEELDGGDGGDGRGAGEDAAGGEVPLTPIQHWFLAGGAAPHFNQAVLLAPRAAVDPGRLRRAVDRLMRHHDALRLRLRQDAGGAWRQEHASPDGAPPPFAQIDLAALGAGAVSAAIERAADQVQRSLDLAAGPILRVVLFAAPRPEPARLLIVAHHLAVDGVSWRILLEDLQTAYQAPAAARQGGLPPRTTSFRRWAERLAVHARSPEVLAELADWLAVSPPGGPRGAAPLPVDLPGTAADDVERAAAVVSVVVEPETTSALLHELPAALRTRIDEVLLTALAIACHGWTGAPGLLVELEGHGREELFDDLDVSRTVGWFTTVYPVFLDLTAGSEPGAALQAVKQRLRRIPHRGIGFGLLRYLAGEDAADRLAALPRPQVSFNYLGQFDHLAGESSLFAPAREAAGELRGGGLARRHLLEVNGLVAAGRLRFDWRYSRLHHRRATVEAVAAGFTAALRALVEHARQGAAPALTTADFSLLSAKQGDLDRLLEKFTRAGPR